MILNKKGIVTNFAPKDDIKRRLLDIGIMKGSHITRVLEDFSGNMSAYLVRGSLVAIRNKDAVGVEVAYEEI